MLNVLWLKVLDITKIKGQTMNTYHSQAMEIVDEMHLSVHEESSVPELASSALGRVQHAAEDINCHRAAKLLDDVDRNRNSKIEPWLPLDG
jgi:hypothetical protein